MTGGPRWSSRPLRDRPIAAEQSVFRPLCRFPHPVAHRGISCRSTTMNAKHAGLSRRCGRWRNSGFHALARHVASMRRVRSSARPRPSAAAVSFGAMPLPGMSATQAAGIGRTQSILLAAAAVCAGRRSRPHWRTAVASSHRAGRCAAARGRPARLAPRRHRADFRPSADTTSRAVAVGMESSTATTRSRRASRVASVAPK